MTDRRKPYRLTLGDNRGSTTLLLTEEHAKQSYPMATLITSEKSEVPMPEPEPDTDSPSDEKQDVKPNKAAEPGGNKAQ